MLEDRILTGLDLYRQGTVTRLLLSGDDRRNGYNEVRTMERLLISRGVPKDVLLRDPYGLSTYESLRRARDVFGVREALLVTQGFHLPRALLLARRLGIDAIGVRADRRIYPFFGFAMRVREFTARVKDWVISAPQLCVESQIPSMITSQMISLSCSSPDKAIGYPFVIRMEGVVASLLEILPS